MILLLVWINILVVSLIIVVSIRSVTIRKLVVLLVWIKYRISYWLLLSIVNILRILVVLVHVNIEILLLNRKLLIWINVTWTLNERFTVLLLNWMSVGVWARRIWWLIQLFHSFCLEFLLDSATTNTAANNEESYKNY